MSDPTEPVRRLLVDVINSDPGSREALEAEHGEVWDTAQLQEAFRVTGFAAPFVAAVRLSDSKKGMLTFQHSPRYYFGFEEV